MSGGLRRWLSRLAAVGVLLGLGCGGSHDLLVAYSGDCQGYSEPCG